MPALCSILNNAYYANNYASIFDAGLVSHKTRSSSQQFLPDEMAWEHIVSAETL